MIKTTDEHRKEASEKGHAGQSTRIDLLAMTKRALPKSGLSETSKKTIDYLIDKRLNRRTKGVLVRNSFVRSKDGKTAPPLSLFAGTQGGAEVALKLYLAILWISAAKPYATNFEAADWALILDLPDPDRKGAARVRRALTKLKKQKLIVKEHIPKQRANQITPLKEDGSGDPYAPPKANKEDDHYFAIPNELWRKGHIQRMSTAALTMLLIVLEEQRREKYKKQWWTQKKFDDHFHISKDTRAKGTKELVDRGLIKTEFRYLRMDTDKPLTPRKTRKTYTVSGEVYGVVEF
jgi:hypothetical protein